jgi:signal peptidase I
VIDEQPTEEQPPKRQGSFWRELPILLGVAVLVAILVRAFVVQTFYIPSGSMEHTLELNDRVLVNKLVYELREPERGEIIVFEAPMHWRSNPNEKDFIKRVIAIGGDHVACCDEQQRLIINGMPLDEPYIYADNGISDPAAPNQFELVVPPGRLWVLGDHRSESGDSMEHYQRSGGDLMASTIEVDAVIGRAFVLFWPPSRMTWLSVPEPFDPVPDPSTAQASSPAVGRAEGPDG